MIVCSFVGTQRGRESVLRILTEMRKLQATPHPAVEVFPCEEDLGFWRVLIEGTS